MAVPEDRRNPMPEVGDLTLVFLFPEVLRFSDERKEGIRDVGYGAGWGMEGSPVW